MDSEFLRDAITQRLFVISDPQFGSQVVFDWVPQRRAFGHIDHLHRALVDNWNAVVGADDYVLCLGDFTQNLKDSHASMTLVEKYTGLLNGRKLLIRGNHDAEVTPWYYDCGWNCLIEYPLVFEGDTMRWLPSPTPYGGCLICEVDGQRILFSHFAIHEGEHDDPRYLVEKAHLRELFNHFECDLNVHGHTHIRPVDHPRCLSACVETTGFKPLRIGDFLRRHIGDSDRAHNGKRAADPLSLGFAVHGETIAEAV